MEKPNFFAIIPANVRYDSELSPNAKLLYGEISALCNKDGCCFATNKYFANVYNISIQTASNLINQLKEKEYIDIEMVYKENSNEIEARKISIRIKENFNRAIKENFKDNNIYSIEYNNIDNNNINNNILYNSYVEAADNTTQSLEKNKYIKNKNTFDEIESIVHYMNKVCGTKYKANSSSTKRHIKARLNEGYKFNDFKDVIDFKWRQWGECPTKFSTGQLSSSYLRPSTLFSASHFEEYLQAAWLDQYNKDKQINIKSNEKLAERSKLEF